MITVWALHNVLLLVDFPHMAVQVLPAAEAQRALLTCILLGHIVNTHVRLELARCWEGLQAYLAFMYHSVLYA